MCYLESIVIDVLVQICDLLHPSDVMAMLFCSTTSMSRVLAILDNYHGVSIDFSSKKMGYAVIRHILLGKVKADLSKQKKLWFTCTPKFYIPFSSLEHISFYKVDLNLSRFTYGLKMCPTLKKVDLLYCTLHEHDPSEPRAPL